jgi:hypothetical protein
MSRSAGLVFLLSLLAGPRDVGAAVTTFAMDLAGFNAAAGNPPVVVDFDSIAPGTDIGGQTIAGVSFSPSPTGAPLIVVRASDTTTPAAGFTGIIDAATNTLPATSGENILSPGGTTLGPGPDDAVENDDLILTFATPVSAVGFDHLSQSADGFGFTNVTVLDGASNVLFSGSIPISNLGGGGAPAAADFWGIVSDANDIARIEVDEGDNNNSFPDCNIGFDTFRVAGLAGGGTTTTTLAAASTTTTTPASGGSTTTTLCDPRTAARRAIEDVCGCAAATNHGAYVHCVAHAANAQVKAGMLSKSSVHSITRCAARSTCGKSGFVTCCRTSAKGRTKCSIKHGAGKCRAPRNGTARTGTQASCCDACEAGGCSLLD